MREVCRILHHQLSAMKLRSFLLFLGILSGIQSVLCQNTIQTAINNFASAPEFTNSSISFLAVDLTSGDRIAAYNPELSIPTASTAKIFSTASAIDILGPNYRPETRLYFDGVIDSLGTLNGNIWIRGGGDVSLGSRFFNDPGKELDFLKKWTDTLQKMGVKVIAGSIIADGSEFGYTGVPYGWAWNDMGNYYGAGPAGICLYDNMIRLKFKTGCLVGSATELISVYPKIDGLIIHNYITSQNVSGDNAYIYGGPYSLDRFAEGALPLNRPYYEVEGSMPDPEYQLAVEFVKVLTEAGITIKEGPKSVRRNDIIVNNRYSTGYKLFLTHKGEKISDIATLTNMRSVNLFAEGLVCLIGYKRVGRGTTDEGLKQIEKYWEEKISLNGMFLKDGSGLSRSNGISAVHFCRILKAMAESKNGNIFFETLPVAGRSGTLTNLCKGQPGQGRVVAKSGTMNRVKSYAGYVNSKSGKKIAFAITVNNYTSNSSAVADKIEKVLNTLAVY